MKKTIKYLGWTNIIGVFITNTCLITFVSLDKDAWGSFYILINLLITVPFLVASIISLRNIDDPNEDQINKTLYTVFFILWIPSLILPFVYELGGLLICITILLIGLWGKFRLRNSVVRLMFLNVIGIIFLILDALVVYGFK